MCPLNVGLDNVDRSEPEFHVSFHGHARKWAKVADVGGRVVKFHGEEQLVAGCLQPHTAHIMPPDGHVACDEKEVWS